MDSPTKSARKSSMTSGSISPSSSTVTATTTSLIATNIPAQINDEDNETVTVYVNGQLVGTVTARQSSKRTMAESISPLSGDTFGNAP